MKSQKMYIIVFGIFIVKLHVSVSDPQYPAHLDLQKVGEAIFNNEKFNILKPTVHLVTDHFKDFMLRTKGSNHPAERIFIDKNGFRHVWSGFGGKTKSLRKTDLKKVSGSFENASENISETDIIATNGNDSSTATVEDTNISDNNASSNESENSSQEEENNASDNSDTAQNLSEEATKTPESTETTIIYKLLPALQKHNSSPKITIDKRLREGKDDKAKAPTKKSDTTKKSEKKLATTKKPDDGKKDAPATKEDGKKTDKKTDSGDKAKTDDKKPKDEKKTKAKEDKTVATTTFFCPYFGTITMSAFID